MYIQIISISFQPILKLSHLLERPELKTRGTEVKVMVIHIGSLVMETTGTGKQVLQAPVIPADETTAIPATFEEKAVAKARKASTRNTALR